MTKEKRVHDFPLGQDLLLSILRGDVVLFNSNVPPDAEIVGVYHDWHCDCLFVRVSHPTFRVQHPGAQAYRESVSCLATKDHQRFPTFVDGQLAPNHNCDECHGTGLWNNPAGGRPTPCSKGCPAP